MGAHPETAQYGSAVMIWGFQGVVLNLAHTWLQRHAISLKFVRSVVFFPCGCNNNWFTTTIRMESIIMIASINDSRFCAAAYLLSVYDKESLSQWLHAIKLKWHVNYTDAAPLVVKKLFLLPETLISPDIMGAQLLIQHNTIVLW